LLGNKTLESLNLTCCGIKEKEAGFIGKGLRGNRNLQVLILKQNPIRGGIVEIAKAFVHNTLALCMKELDVSKCFIESEHITSDFIRMIKSEYCTLKVLNLKDNFIKMRAAESIKDALKHNRTITKLHLEFNPVKEQVMRQIGLYCKRNVQIDSINDHSKNIVIMEQKKHKSHTQKEALHQEIKDLKSKTDSTIRDVKSLIG